MKMQKELLCMLAVIIMSTGAFSQNLNSDPASINVAKESSSQHVHNMDGMIEQIKDIRAKLATVKLSDSTADDNAYQFDINAEAYVGRDELIRHAKEYGTVDYQIDYRASSAAHPFENLAKNIGSMMNDMQKLMDSKSINPSLENDLHEMEEHLAVVLATFDGAVQKVENPKTDE